MRSLAKIDELDRQYWTVRKLESHSPSINATYFLLWSSALTWSLYCLTISLHTNQQLFPRHTFWNFYKVSVESWCFSLWAEEKSFAEKWKSTNFWKTLQSFQSSSSTTVEMLSKDWSFFFLKLSRHPSYMICSHVLMTHISKWIAILSPLDQQVSVFRPPCVWFHFILGGDPLHCCVLNAHHEYSDVTRPLVSDLQGCKIELFRCKRFCNGVVDCLSNLFHSKKLWIWQKARKR